MGVSVGVLAGHTKDTQVRQHTHTHAHTQGHTCINYLVTQPILHGAGVCMCVCLYVYVCVSVCVCVCVCVLCHRDEKARVQFRTNRRAHYGFKYWVACGILLVIVLFIQVCVTLVCTETRNKPPAYAIGLRACSMAPDRTRHALCVCMCVCTQNKYSLILFTQLQPAPWTWLKACIVLAPPSFAC